MTDPSQETWRVTEETGRVSKGSTVDLRVLLRMREDGTAVVQVRKFKRDEPTGERVTIPITGGEVIGAEEIARAILEAVDLYKMSGPSLLAASA